MDSYGQIYVPLEFEHAAGEEKVEDEKEKTTKNEKDFVLVWPLLVPYPVQPIQNRIKI